MYNLNRVGLLAENFKCAQIKIQILIPIFYLLTWNNVVALFFFNLPTHTFFHIKKLT